MKKLSIILLIGVFLFAGCANYTQRGAAIGAGAGTVTSVIAGKSGTTAALLIMGGALLGGIVGNSMDEEARKTSIQNPGRNVIQIEEHPNTGSTNCHKVTKKTWRDGKVVSNITEEVCTGNKRSNTY